MCMQRSREEPSPTHGGWTRFHCQAKEPQSGSHGNTSPCPVGHTSASTASATLENVHKLVPVYLQPSKLVRTSNLANWCVPPTRQTGAYLQPSKPAECSHPGGGCAALGVSLPTRAWPWLPGKRRHRSPRCLPGPAAPRRFARRALPSLKRLCRATGKLLDTDPEYRKKQWQLGPKMSIWI